MEQAQRVAQDKIDYGECVGAAEFLLLAIVAGLAAYGFIASVLPVWVLLCPRDYLSSFLKIGTIALLVLGVGQPQAVAMSFENLSRFLRP